MQSRDKSFLVSVRFVHVPNIAPINNTNNNIIFSTLMFTLQLPHSTSSLQHLRGERVGALQGAGLMMTLRAGVCKVQLFARSRCDGLTGAILGCFVSCHSFIPTK